MDSLLEAVYPQSTQRVHKAPVSKKKSRRMLSSTSLTTEYLQDRAITPSVGSSRV